MNLFHSVIHNQTKKCGKMIIDIIGADEAFQFKKKSLRTQMQAHYSNKKNSTTSLLQCITLLHNTSKYSYNCRERPEVPRLVTLADNMKVPLDVDFSVLFPLFPIWRSVVNSHSNKSHHLSSSIRLLI